MDEFEATQGQTPETESPTVEEPADAPETTEDVAPETPDAPDSDDGDTVDTGEPEKGPIPYERFAEVNQRAKAYREALESQGLRYDEATGTVVPLETETPAWDEPEPEAGNETAANTLDDPGFWRMAPEDMVEDPTWRAIAEQYGLDADEMARNEAQLFKQQVYRDWQAQQARAQSEQAAEQDAFQQVKRWHDGMTDDPDFAGLESVQQEIGQMVAYARKAGVPYREIVQQREVMEAIAIRKNLDAVVARKAQQKTEQAGRRARTLGAQSPTGSNGAAANDLEITAEMEAVAQQLGVDPQALAARLKQERDA